MGYCPTLALSRFLLVNCCDGHTEELSENKTDLCINAAEIYIYFVVIYVVFARLNNFVLTYLLQELAHASAMQQHTSTAIKHTSNKNHALNGNTGI